VYQITINDKIAEDNIRQTFSQSLMFIKVIKVVNITIYHVVS